jgi:hypothetical protein
MVSIDRNVQEVGCDKPVLPSVNFLYGDNGEIVGEATPIVGPIVEAFIDGRISVGEYSELIKEEAAANQRLRDFMYGNQPPDFMPKISRAARWYGWLKHMIS